MNDTLKRFFGELKKNKRITYLWGGVIIALLLLLVLRPGKEARDEAKAKYLQEIKDTTIIDVTLKMNRYLYKVLQEQAQDENMSEGAYVGTLVKTKGNLEQIKNNLKALSKTVTETKEEVQDKK